MSNENDSDSGKACAIVLSVILVVILFFPMMATVTDGGSLDESQEQVLRSIYPNAEIEQ